VNKRREFFKQFIGQIGVYRDEIRGVENIPLNRLKELPESIIQEIEPVFFPEEIWYLKEKVIQIPGNKHSGSQDILLNDLEYKAFCKFKNGKKLKQTATEIYIDSELSFEETYQIVTSLFFRLAALRICHPKAVYHIDEILNSKSKNQDVQF
jgi:hypothetical protein